MKDKIKQKWIKSQLPDFLSNLFIRAPRRTLTLIFRPKYWNAPTCYPERKRKSAFLIYLDQLYFIWKYRTINKDYFLLGLDTIPFKEVREFLPYRPFALRRDFLNFGNPKSSDICLLRNKFYFGIFANAIGIPTPKNVAYIRDGKIFMIDERKYVTLEEFVKSGDYNLFCKVMNGECGVGIFNLRTASGKVFINGEESQLSQIENIIGTNEYIFQTAVENQHHAISKIYPHSINTIRMVTARNLKTGQIDVLPSIIRIGSHGHIMDNASQGGYCVQIDLETGKLHKNAFIKLPAAARCLVHDDTGVTFENCEIPYFEEAKRMALHFHSMLGNIHSVGWDIAITENGPVFIEGNDNWGLRVVQIDGVGWRKYFRKYFF